MISRLFGTAVNITAAITAVLILSASVAMADGPGYTHIGISYEWSDTKYGTTPSSDQNFNNGSIEGENLNFSIGFLDLLHFQGQLFGYLNGTCNSCNKNPDGSSFDADVEGYKFGPGVNLGLDMIGLSENADLVLRVNYIDIEYSKLNFNSPPSISDDGWSAEVMINGKISDQAEVYVAYEYTDLGDAGARDLKLGLNYYVWNDLSLIARGIIFDSETAFELGARWNFGDFF